MTEPFVIIDGYNLMHAVGLARRNYGPGDLEVCRNRLIQQLADRLTDKAMARTTIVFDAFSSEDDSHRSRIQRGLRVVYAPAGTDADSEIERIVTRHSAPRQLLVVSSDHRLHRAARRRKAVAIDSDRFWKTLEPDSAPSESRQTGRQQPIDFWMREFSDVTDDLRNSTDADEVFDADYLTDLESELDD